MKSLTIMVVIVLLGINAFLYLQWANQTKVSTALAGQLEDVRTERDQIQASYEYLEKQRLQDIKILEKLTSEVAKVRQITASAQKAVSTLESVNDTVKAYLQLPVPSELSGVLNKATGVPAKD